MSEFHGHGYSRQNLVYQTRPGFWVTANLYLPKDSKGRIPGIVIAHSLHGPKTQFELQDMGILWARAGCAVLVMDQVGYGERLEAYPWERETYHSRYVTGMQLYLVGESLIKWMAVDIIRGIDLLLDRKDIDDKQIILLGAVAGGGDPAAVVAAVDKRVSTVVPFNFGESTPEIPRFIPEKNQWPLDLADPGLSDWDTTRCLRRGVVDQFLQCTICALVAPRRFVYSYELGWNVEELPAWARYKKVYDAISRKRSVSQCARVWSVSRSRRMLEHRTGPAKIALPDSGTLVRNSSSFRRNAGVSTRELGNGTIDRSPAGSGTGCADPGNCRPVAHENGS
jgi:hypothetical protein